MSTDNDIILMWATKQDYSKNMAPPAKQPVSSLTVSSGRDNKKIIKDSIRKSKRKYFRYA